MALSIGFNLNILLFPLTNTTVNDMSTMLLFLNTCSLALLNLLHFSCRYMSYRYELTFFFRLLLRCS